jgi:hypothetical protein
VLTASCGTTRAAARRISNTDCASSAATNNQTGEGVAIKKVTNVFSKKILAKRALREIKLLQHFRGMSMATVGSNSTNVSQDTAT